MRLFKLKTEGQTIQRKPYYKVTKLKFSFNPGQELRFRLDLIYILFYPKDVALLGRPSGRRSSAIKFDLSIVSLGAFHSTKNSEVFKTGTNGTYISWERFKKIRKLLNFRKANHSTENSGNSTMKIKWNRNFPVIVFENLGIPREVVLFVGNYANSQFSIEREFFWPRSPQSSQTKMTATCIGKWIDVLFSTCLSINTS